MLYACNPYLNSEEGCLSLFDALKSKHIESVGEETFKASHGWFQRFKVHANLRNIKVSGEASSADMEAAAEVPKIFSDIIDEGGYLPEKVINVDETGLYWKKMPDCTYIELCPQFTNDLKGFTETVDSVANKLVQLGK